MQYIVLKIVVRYCPGSKLFAFSFCCTELLVNIFLGNDPIILVFEKQEIKLLQMLYLQALETIQKSKPAFFKSFLGQGQRRALNQNNLKQVPYFCEKFNDE